MKKTIIATTIFLAVIITFFSLFGSANAAQATVTDGENDTIKLAQTGEQISCTLPAGDWSAYDIKSVKWMNYLTNYIVTIEFYDDVNLTAILMGYFNGALNFVVNDTLDEELSNANVLIAFYATWESGPDAYVLDGTVMVLDGDYYEMSLDGCGTISGAMLNITFPQTMLENITNILPLTEWAVYGETIYTEIWGATTITILDIVNWDDNSLRLSMLLLCGDIVVPGYPIVLIVGVSVLMVVFIGKRKNIHLK
jgi:hypothetical protein